MAGMSTTARTAAIASIIGVCLSVIPGLVAYGALNNTVQNQGAHIQENRVDIRLLQNRQADFSTSIEVLKQSDARQEEMLKQIIRILERP